MLELTPRVYSQNLKWALIPSNKIDTVSLRITDNTIGDPTTFHVENFSVCTPQNGVATTLPISNTNAPTHTRIMYNSRWVPFETVQYAKARIECVMASGERTFTVQDAIQGIPTASLELTGNSSIVARGGSTYETYPSLANLQAYTSYSIAEWIEQHKTETQNNLTWDYSDNKFSMNPWIRKYIPMDLSGSTAPTVNDILTTWNDPSLASRTWATAQDWYDQTSWGATGEKIRMWPTNPEGSDLGALLACAIQMYNLSMSTTVSVQKITDYQFKVQWTAPVRFAYLAASRTRGGLGTLYELDNSAFVDNITNVAVKLTGVPFSVNTIDKSYGLDGAVITTNAPNTHPIKLEASEAFTLGTSFYGAVTPWHLLLAELILSTYKNGKYVVECSVPTMWALDHNIHVNSEMRIRLQNSQLISRNGIPCTFKVKTIEKRFSATSTTYALRLMEV